jgi:predicted RNase H-like HicB family nuclease
MIVHYIDRALRRASYDKLEDGTYVAEVDGLPGVLATADTLEGCRDQLAEVVEGWVLFRIANAMDVPALDGITVSASAVG